VPEIVITEGLSGSASLEADLQTQSCESKGGRLRMPRQSFQICRRF